MSPMFFFLSLALDLCHPFPHWASLVCRLLSLFRFLSLPLYSKFVDMTINLSLILLTTRIQKQFPLSVFVFIDSLVDSALQYAGGYTISGRNNLEVVFGLPYLLIELFYIGMPVVRTVVRSVYGHVITKFSGMDRFSYPWCSAACARAPL